MCGIVGYVGKQKAAPFILEGLKRLEYRGYDSTGVAILENGAFKVVKKIGRVANLEKEVAKAPPLARSEFIPPKDLEQGIAARSRGKKVATSTVRATRPSRARACLWPAVFLDCSVKNLPGG